nr:zinc-binding dehydrogenase [Micromonospora coriariae]
MRLAESGGLQIPVAATFSLTAAAAAHELSEARHAPGRIALVN